MKFKVLLSLSIVIVLFVFLSMGNPLKFFEGDTGEKLARTKHLVKWKPDKFSDAGKKEVIKRIDEILAILEKLSSKGNLNEKQIKGIEEFYGDAGVFTKHDGNTLIGGDNIASYFSNERENIKNIEFKLEYVHAEELTHILNNPDKKTPEDAIVHVLYLIISCSFDYQGERIDPPSSKSEKHMKSCEWD